MNEVAIQELIELAIARLVELQLCDGSIDSYRNLAFQPVSDFYYMKSEVFYRSELMDELSHHYQELFHGGNISRNTLRWCLRGLGILNELKKTGSFEWKVFIAKKESPLPFYYEEILTRFLSSLGDLCRIGIYKSIAERYFLFLTINGHHTIEEVSPADIRNFIVDMFAYRPKSNPPCADQAKSGLLFYLMFVTIALLATVIV